MTIVMTVVLAAAVLWLAYSNGANDNFKGVATLYGSATMTFRGALAWATAATLAGSLVSILLARGLVAAFSGKGLIDGAAVDSAMLAAVGGGAAATIFLATMLGMPTSTTHALSGALVGMALVAHPAGIQWSVIGGKFATPLLLSPILAVGLTAGVYPLLRRARRALGVERHTCLCIGKGAPQPVTIGADGAAILSAPSGERTIVRIGRADRCVERYAGRFIGVEAQTAVDTVHCLSGAAVCFARAVNDTPKIAALLLAGSAAGAAGSGIGTSGALGLVTAAVVIGGLVQAHRVAETMSKRITDLNPGQGLTGNLVTALLVIGASRLGVPVSTTHVSCGSIFGIGLVNRRTRWPVVGRILLTWVTTLPLGLALGALFYSLLA